MELGANEFPKDDIRILVSSKHLTLSSDVFKTMLSNNFQEGHTLQEKGSATISLLDDEPAAFEILMNIIHSKYTSLPRDVTVEILTCLAVLVDKYQFREAAKLIVEKWLDQMEEKFYSDLNGKVTFSKNHLCYMVISWVFKREGLSPKQHSISAIPYAILMPKTLSEKSSLIIFLYLNGLLVSWSRPLSRSSLIF